MKVRTTLQTAGYTMASTFIAIMAADKWRWNQSVTYSLRAAIAFQQEKRPRLLPSKTVTTHNMDNGFMVYEFPDGSRIGVIKRDKSCWQIAGNGDKIVAGEVVR